MAADLRAAGLARVNVSLDSLRRDRFHELTRRDELDRVLDGIAASIEAGFRPVKINVVMLRGVNDDEILDFAAWGRQLGVVVRFIEFMPLDADHGWSQGSVVTYDEIVETISSVYPLEPLAQGSDPAQSFRYADGGGEIGVVASVTRSFCASCDRVRITAEGKFRNCLFALEETDLRAVLRGGGTDDDLAEAMRGSVAAKWAGHGIGSVSFVQPPRTMSQIGG
jgi:GTP 3',8-cyclase